jgi:hypothetical protein
MKSNTKQLIWGLIFGIIFGFLLQKGGVTSYDVIVGQLRLTDFTVLKVIFTAIIVGMIGIHLMRDFSWVQFSVKPGSLGKNVIGGLLFGVGFALLGYCPGTIAGAIGNGQLDALIGGLPGILLGSWLLAVIYPKIRSSILQKGDFGDLTLPGLLKVNQWVVIIPLAVILVGVMLAF